MVGVIVDGLGDYAALRSRFLGRVLVMKAEGPRGHTVSAEALTRSCKKQVGILVGLGCNSVVVVTDFEERSCDYEDFCRTVAEGLVELCAPVPVSCCVAHRMIENWFLADIEQLSRERAYIRKRLRQKQYEGTHGKKELKSVFEPGHFYNEVAHGKELMKTIRLEVAKKNSVSFRRFLGTIRDQ